MNIISYDIELKRPTRTEEKIFDVIKSCISKNYCNDLDNRQIIEKTWDDLPYPDFVAINSSAHLLFSFTTENVQVYLFKKETKNVVSMNDLSITVFALSPKEINLILKSSYLKLISIFSKELKVSIIEGTPVTLYPFDSNKNDVLNPDFSVKATYDNRVVNFETKDWVKLIIFIVITGIFIILYFTTPSEIIDSTTKEKTVNNIKEVYSVGMGIGISFVLIEMITNLLIPKVFRPKHPKVLIENFSSIFENKGIKQVKVPERPQDPETD